MAEKILERNKIKFVPIPEKIIKHTGLRPGSYVEVTDDGYHIILTPIEEDYTEEELNKIEKLAKQKGGKSFDTWEEADKHLKSLMRKNK